MDPSLQILGVGILGFAWFLRSERSIESQIDSLVAKHNGMYFASHEEIVGNDRLSLFRLVTLIT